jgi:glutamine synthetase
MLRIPRGGGRVECRAADSANNPYLGGALMLAAGLEGIREALDPGEPNRDNLYRLTEAGLAARGIGWLPRSLGEAIDALEADPLVRQCSATRCSTRSSPRNAPNGTGTPRTCRRGRPNAT